MNSVPTSKQWLVEPNPESWRANLGQAQIKLDGPRQAEWWTGIKPDAATCPGRDADGVVHALPQINLATCTRAEVQAYFANGWLLTELLFASLQGEEAFYRPPYHALRHPLVFYYVHPAVLYANKLIVAKLLPQPVDAGFEALFATGVDEMRWDDMAKNNMRWPSIDAAKAYRAQIYRLVTQVIAEHPGLADGHPPVTMADPLWALFMGFEHERIHFETSSVLIRELPVRLLATPPHFPELHPSALAPSSPLPPHAATPAPMVKVAPGQVRIGKAADVPYYGWDNEYGERVVDVPAFEAQTHLVSNGEFHRFLVAGGYRDKSLWSDEGWRWRTFRNAKAPTFWVLNGPQGSHSFRLRTLFTEVAMRWDWPALVNCHEAEAYAKWKTSQGNGSYRLMTESEHHRLREASADQIGAANLDLKWASESPVDLAATAPTDVRGNVWQWCMDDFHPLTGFRIHDYYDDFSTPCFDGEHRMILGGSFISTGAEASAWARFHFRPHFFQHAGIRLVRTESGHDGGAVRIERRDVAQTAYESEQLWHEYMLLHYGSAADQMPYAFGPQGTTGFPQRCAALGLDWAKRLNLDLHRALDIGCAVGGASFALAQTVTDEVLGIDLSARFIEAAQTLQETGQLRYFRRDEGELGVWLTAQLALEVERQRTTFRRGDACSLPPDLGAFDLVLMANLICRIPAPRSCLQRMGGERGLVRPGGLLVLTNPFSWMESYTPKEAWLGGRRVGDRELWSEDGLKEVLDADFELLEKTELPLVIREHRRKFQYIVPDAYVFRRRGG